MSRGADATVTFGIHPYNDTYIDVFKCKKGKLHYRKIVPRKGFKLEVQQSPFVFTNMQTATDFYLSENSFFLAVLIVQQ